MIFWFGETRRFFCLDSGKCITVWKTYNNKCYIIPDKYYGLLKPSDNYIELSNTSALTIYSTTDLPNAIIYKSDQNLKVTNNNKNKIAFYDYNSDIERFDRIIYTPYAQKNNDIKSNARVIDIFIKDNYAIDKDGKKL